MDTKIYSITSNFPIFNNRKVSFLKIGKMILMFTYRTYRFQNLIHMLLKIVVLWIITIKHMQ